jgi:NTE family protein
MNPAILCRRRNRLDLTKGFHAFRSFFHPWLIFLGMICFLGGCAHYPPNPYLKECSTTEGYRLKTFGHGQRSDRMLLFLTFSGGGTRAASLAYGVLEELARTEIFLEGKKRTMLDEVDAISGVSGGSFTASYYGLFGRRIFEDFESRFLKKDIQKELFDLTLEPSNWFRLSSGKFGRSDLVAEYYDQNIFEGKTFGDIAATGGPFILVNATDVTLGTYFSFSQDMFDILCSDVSRVPVSRAVAASSAVPVLLSPIALYNYAGSCNYKPPEWMEKALNEPYRSRRQSQQALHLKSYMDAQKKPYIHLIDGGMSDNLGLRAAIDRLIPAGDIWQSLQYFGWENTQKVVFILVNAEKEPEAGSDQLEKTLTSGWVLKSVTNIPIVRYNFETVELLNENFKKWAGEISMQRCSPAKQLEKLDLPDLEMNSCKGIDFYLIEVDFDDLPDPTERSYFKKLPTSFYLVPEAVDRLRDAAHRILRQSPEFQRLLKDLQ